MLDVIYHRVYFGKLISVGLVPRYERDRLHHVGVYSVSLLFIRGVSQNNGKDKTAAMQPDTRKLDPT